ncbi:50S ribosomal protein L19 [candidate division WOR-3 bacterium]|nr:50S ribosomal protein L19 [candidate division WOR-3 bacterium]
MEKIKTIEASQMTNEVPQFSVGDTVAVRIKIKEGDKTLIRLFKGAVIAMKNGKGARGTFTVRKISDGVGVERVFPLHSPVISSIKVLKKGKVRRAKLYYLRQRTGKATKIKERR